LSEQSWTDGLTRALASVGETVLAHLPNVVAALILVVAGWVAARLLRRLSAHVLERVLQRLSRTRALRGTSAHMPARSSAPPVVGAVVFWTVLAFFVAAAIEALGLQAVSSVLGTVTVYLPRVLLGLVVAFVGVWGAQVARAILVRAASGVGVGYADVLGRVVQAIIVVLAVILAMDQVGVDSAVLSMSLATALAATFGAVGLAFGLGARSVVGNIIAARYVQRTYRVGDTVRMGELEGRIVEITDTAVMLEGADGRVMIPAQRFSDEVSVRVEREGR